MKSTFMSTPRPTGKPHPPVRTLREFADLVGHPYPSIRTMAAKCKDFPAPSLHWKGGFSNTKVQNHYVLRELMAWWKARVEA